MLILTRKMNERIRFLLPDGTEIWLVNKGHNPKGGGVKLGIEAPPGVEVLREELIVKRRETPQ